MKDLESLPCLTYEQGDQNSFYFSEEILSTLNHEKSIKVTDKGTIIDLMTGTDGYTISSGICPSFCAATTSSPSRWMSRKSSALV